MSIEQELEQYAAVALQAAFRGYRHRRGASDSASQEGIPPASMREPEPKPEPELELEPEPEPERAPAPPRATRATRRRVVRESGAGRPRRSGGCGACASRPAASGSAGEL